MATPRDTADSARLLRRLARGLEKREALHSGAAREGLDIHLLELVERLKSQVQQTFAEEVTQQPPRSVAVSMALAIYSQPHLDITFGAPRWQGTEDLIPPDMPEPDPPLLFQPESMKVVLGLEEWELDELREETDRRVGRVLLQRRALEWLWQRFAMPDGDARALFHALFPSAPLAQGESIGWIRYGSQLYAVADQNPPPPLSSLYLGWVPVDEHSYSPLDAFHGRYVDEGLRRALGRSTGASPGEVVDLLDRMVTIVPRRDCGTYLLHDQWRISGVGPLTGLGGSYSSGGWLSRALAPHDLYVKDFLEVLDGRLVLKGAEAAFDAYATDRSSIMLNHLYAEMLARMIHEDARTAPRVLVDDLSLYDVSRHLRRVLQPLLDWARLPETSAHLARVFKVPVGDADKVLKSLAGKWERRASDHWYGPPGRDRPETVGSVLLLHLISSHNNLRHAFRRGGFRRVSHRELLLLFAAHHYAEASVGRILREHRLGKPMGDPVARWFWGTWQLLLADSDYEPEPTWSGPNPLV